MSTNNLAKEIVAELDSVRQNLSTFKSNAAYLNDAKSNLDTVLQTLKNSESALDQKVIELDDVLKNIEAFKQSSEKLISKIAEINFPERLSIIEDTAKNTVSEIEKANASTINQIAALTRQVVDAEISNNLLKLRSVVDSSARSNELVAGTIIKQDVPGKIEDFAAKVENTLSKGYDGLHLLNKQNNNDFLKIINEMQFPIRMDKLDSSVTGIQTGVMGLINKTEHFERMVREEFKDLFKRQQEQEKILKNRHHMLLILLTIIVLGTAIGFLLLSGILR